MMRALWTAASGMTAQQYNVDTIANNLSNVNTTGFKKIRAEFEDLIYQTHNRAGTPATENTLRPLGNQVGHGTKLLPPREYLNKEKCSPQIYSLTLPLKEMDFTKFFYLMELMHILEMGHLKSILIESL